MMDALTYTLLSDGSSDEALLPILSWLLRAQGVGCAIQPEWADLRRLPKPPKTLPDRIVRSLELYPCNLLFVHRDAEGEPRTHRVTEIQGALCQAAQQITLSPSVCVVPVRMQEAWLLFDEGAIRRAAGNPNGRRPLSLPRLTELEKEPNPKRILYELLCAASGLLGRRRKRFPANKSARRVADFIDDFSPLRALPAFCDLEAEVKQEVAAQGWRQT